MTHTVLSHRAFARAIPQAVPIQRTALELARQAAAALAVLALIRLQSQYDIAAFRLRALLQQLDNLPAGDLPAEDRDAAILLWRLQVFDANCDTHFLTGLPNLRAWAALLLQQDTVAMLKAPLAATHFLAQQRCLGGLLTNPQRDTLWQPICKNHW